MTFTRTLLTLFALGVFALHALADDPFAQPAAPDPFGPDPKNPAPFDESAPDTAQSTNNQAAPLADDTATDDESESFREYGVRGEDGKGAGMEIKSQKDAWKQKYLVWDYGSSKSNVQRIQQALDDDTALEFIETPLSDVLEFLMDFHQVPLMLDHAALKEIHVESDLPITLNLRGVSLRSALRSMLHSEGMDFVIENEVIVITTKSAAAAATETRVYETRLLPHLSPDEVGKVLVAGVSPKSWKENGDIDAVGSVTPIPGGLVVVQTQAAHNAIVELLRQLQNHADNPLYDKLPNATRR